MLYTTTFATVLTVITAASAAYVPHAARMHHIRNLSPDSHVLKRADGPRPEVSPFLNSDGKTIPGPVYGFPGDLVDPSLPAAPSLSTPQAPAPAPTEPIVGFPGEGEAPAPSPEAPSPSPAPPAPEDPKVEWITATIDGQVVSWENNYFGNGAAPAPTPVEPAPTPAAGLPDVGKDQDGNEVKVEYAYSTKWSTAVAYVTASP